jgi:hypothetical protein
MEKRVTRRLPSVDARARRSHPAPLRLHQQRELVQRNPGGWQSAVRVKATFVALVAFSVLPHLALAQTSPRPPPKREGSAEFAFVGTTGNSSTQTIGLGGEFIYRPSPWESKFKVSYVRNEAEDQLRAQALVRHARCRLTKTRPRGRRCGSRATPEQRMRRRRPTQADRSLRQSRPDP